MHQAEYLNARRTIERMQQNVERLVAMRATSLELESAIAGLRAARLDFEKLQREATPEQRATVSTAIIDRFSLRLSLTLGNSGVG
jgi:hypothetical protein